MTKPDANFVVPRLFLDSGVFGAWSRGRKIDIKKYIKFIRDNEDYIHVYATVDEIPGVFGQKRTLDQVEYSALHSYQNHQRLKDAGLSPIPIYHQGESIKWLYKLLEDGERYIGISTAKDLPWREQRSWLDHVFTVITNEEGRPYVRTHGFGITNVKFLLRYPWYTVDSTTWALSAGYGQIYLPRFIAGKPDYNGLPLILSISDRDRSFKKTTYSALGRTQQRHLLEHLQKLGLTVEQVRYSPEHRRSVTLNYFETLSAKHKLTPFMYRETGFDFDHVKPVSLDHYADHDRFTVMYATSLTRQFSRQLTSLNIGTRLLSYFDLMDQPEGALQEYVETGGGVGYEQRIPAAKWNEEYKSFRRLALINRMEVQDEA